MSSPEQLLEVIQIQTEIAKLGLDLGGVMSLVAERAHALVGANGAAIELAEGEDMVYRAVAGAATPQLGLRLKLQTSMSGLCVRTGEMLRCDDSETDDRVDRDACRRVGLRSMIVMPLKHKGTTVGVLKAMSERPNAFSAADMTLLGLLSEVVGAAMFFATKYDTDDLFFKATHDSMTGVANRALFMDRLRSALFQSERDARPVGVLMIDMNGLKQVNDTYGHRIGDAMIQEFARRVQGGTRNTDTVARLGGDEFGAILTPVEEPHGLALAMKRVQEAIDSEFQFEGRSYPLTASVGVACFPVDGPGLEHLLELADKRMYAVKQAHYASRRAAESLPA